jgi:hypothetical protein
MMALGQDLKELSLNESGCGKLQVRTSLWTKSERKCVMVKTSLLLAMAASITFGCSVYGEGITNIIQCMNIALTSDVFKRFPTNATATAQDCVLSFVKGSVHGDLRTFA